MIIEDLVSRAPVSVSRDARIIDVARRMDDRDVGSVVVVDDGEPVGVVTDRDIALAMADGVRDASVEDVMTPHALTIETRADIEAALAKMESHEMRRIVVVEDGKLVGVVSLDDILIHVGNTLGKAASLIRSEIFGPR